MAEQWSGNDSDGSWQDESDSLFIATAPFCDSVVSWAGVDGVSLALLSESPNSRELVFASNAVAQRIDELQFALGEGPCLTSHATGRPQCITDIAHHSRWVVFCREVMDLGAGAVFSFPVAIGSHPVGVLELYRRETGALTVDEYDAALGCAAAVGAVIGSMYARWSHRVAEDEYLNGAALAALTESDPFSRSEVRVAAGIIAEGLGVSIGEALVRMRAHAFANDLRVIDVASNVVSQQVPWSDWCEAPVDDPGEASGPAS